jgi:hypothetical protein
VEQSVARSFRENSRLRTRGSVRRAPAASCKSLLRFYEKVIKVKADVAALLILFSPTSTTLRPGGVESCQGRRFLAFISTLDGSPRHFIIERGTKRNAVQLGFVLSPSGLHYECFDHR